MNAQSESFEEEYEEYDEFDEDDEGERGLSGLVVLLMGVVMLGAFASVVWIAYQQGIKTGGARESAPYVAADPEPLKIENKAAAEAGEDRPVYDRVAGAEGEPVETVAEGPEEPATRSPADPIAAIARGADEGAEVVDDAVADRIATLAAADDVPAPSPPKPAATAPKPAEPALRTPPPPTKTAAASPPSASSASGGALSGSHLVQVGAFRSEEEAAGVWTRLQGKLGDYLGGKSRDVERADLGDKGVYYRLRIGPFASSDDAKTYCEGLKSRGQDCLVKAK
ncbi:MAG: SPOR domain-containing protein [Amphiplicatus sp.]